MYSRRCQLNWLNHTWTKGGEKKRVKGLPGGKECYSCGAIQQAVKVGAGNTYRTQFMYRDPDGNFVLVKKLETCKRRKTAYDHLMENDSG